MLDGLGGSKEVEFVINLHTAPGTRGKALKICFSQE